MGVFIVNVRLAFSLPCVPKANVFYGKVLVSKCEMYQYEQISWVCTKEDRPLFFQIFFTNTRDQPRSPLLLLEVESSRTASL